MEDDFVFGLNMILIERFKDIKIVLRCLLPAPGID
jgi:hypothetical protein